jgi:hypothetical protein
MSITSTHVTFEQAKVLKEKGFDLEVIKYWNGIGKYFDFKNYFNWNQSKDFISIPEQWQVIEWLRFNHGIWIAITSHSSGCYYPKLQICSDDVWDDYELRNKVLSGNRELFEFISPQDAYSAAFDYVLNKLI